MRTAQITSLAILFIILAVICLVAYSVYESDNTLALFLFNFALVVFGFLAFPRIVRKLRYRVRERAPSAEQVMAEDPRPPVVYLRSFREDGTRPEKPVIVFSPLPTYIDKPTYEEDISHLLKKIGPFVALSDTKHGAPELGASRLATRSENWRQTFESLIYNCCLVVFRAGDSESLMWELNRLVQCVDSRKVIIYLQIGKENDQAVQQARYNKFRRLTATVFPKPLPENRGKNAYLTFGQNWDPILGKNLKKVLQLKGYLMNG